MCLILGRTRVQPGLWMSIRGHVFLRSRGVDCTPSNLRHFAVAAARCSIGYTRREAFDPTERRPLSFCYGSIVADLEGVLAEPLPIADPVAASIRSLLDVGESREYIAGAVGMWLDIPATTDLVEEAHGGGASLKRDHKAYGERTLRARSVIHQTRALVHASPFDRRMAKLAESM